VHEATGADIVLQDYPALTGVRVGTDALVSVIERCPFVVAVKAEAPPTAAAIARLAPRVDVPIFGGLGGVALLDELAAGAAGAMTGFSHPEALAAVLAAWRTGGFPAAHAAWAPWLPLATFEQQAGIALALRKQLLARRGILDDPAVRAPAAGVPPGLLPLLDQHLATVAAH
jgi:4-hydroxy-tetrahydrodipicolinate synthase